MKLSTKIQNVINKLPSIMAIINLTDDSFSYDGLYNKGEKNARSTHSSSKLMANNHYNIAMTAVENGAKIIDIGGESSKPDAKQISVEEEWKRIKTLIKDITPVATFFKVSVDTQKAEIARRAINEGVNIINDISFGEDKDMFQVIAGHDVQYILTHNSNSKVVNIANTGEQVSLKALYPKQQTEGLQQFSRAFKSSVSLKVDDAFSQGIKHEQIILDLGFGFGKTIQQNFLLCKLIPTLKKQFAFPIMIGASRKSSIGSIINQQPQHRLSGSLAVALFAMEKEIQYLRVHDVRKTIEAMAVNYYLKFPEEIFTEIN